MVPDKFNMVDMEGIDILAVHGEAVPGLYNKLVESIAQCRYQCLYNWESDGVKIPPTFVELVIDPDNGNILINSEIYVTPEDVITTFAYSDYLSAFVALTGDPISDLSLTASIEALTARSNQITGESDTNLSDAVYTLESTYERAALLNRVVAEQDFDSGVLQAFFPSNYSDYDFFVIINHGTTIANDWFYYPFNTTATSGEYITTRPDNFTDIVNFIYKINNSYYLKRGTLGGVAVEMGSNNYTCIKAYKASGRIAPGSYIELYGIKL